MVRVMNTLLNAYKREATPTARGGATSDGQANASAAALHYPTHARDASDPNKNIFLL